MADDNNDIPNPTFTYTFVGGRPHEDVKEDKTNYIFTCDRDFIFRSDDSEKKEKMFAKVMKDNNWTEEDYVTAIPDWHDRKNDYGPITFYRGVITTEIDDNRDFTPEQAEEYQKKYFKPTIPEKDDLMVELIGHLQFLVDNGHTIDSNQYQSITQILTKNQIMMLYGREGILTHDQLAEKWESGEFDP